MADIKSEPRPDLNRNRWSDSYWNAWPAPSKYADIDLCSEEEGYRMVKKTGLLKNIFGRAKSSKVEPAKVSAATAPVVISDEVGTSSRLDGAAKKEELAVTSVSECRVEPKNLAVARAPAEVECPMGATPEAEIPSPAPKKSMRAGLRAQLASRSLYLHDLRSGVNPFSLGKGMASAMKTDEDGVEYLELAHGALDAESGRSTGGYSIRLPDNVESAASGNRIVVRAIGRATGGGQSRFALSYSTNEVGNSGWRWFTLGAESSAVAFTFDVSPMIKGNGDFIGILAEPEGKRGVDVYCVSVEIVPKAAAA